MKILNLSSGATKFIGIVAKAYDVIVYSGYKPDVITGISAGAIASLPIAMGMWDIMKEKGLNITIDDLFVDSPVNDKGKFKLNVSSLMNGSIGTQRIQELLSEFITEEQFIEYCNDDSLPICFVQSININTGQRKIWNLKQVGYEEALDAIASSAAIPIYTQPVSINGDLYFDGGLRDTVINLSNLKLRGRTREVISIYSQPDTYLQLSKVEEKFSSMVNIVENTISILLQEARMNDVERERKYCIENNVSLKQFFLPPVMDGFYDFDKKKLEELYRVGLETEPLYIYLSTIKNKKK